MSETIPLSAHLNQVTPTPPKIGGVRREDVIAAFELLLGRQPESEEAITSHMGLSDRLALGEVIRSSSEFRFRHALDTTPPITVAEILPHEATRAVRVATYDFGAEGSAVAHLRGGWADPEGDFCWSTGMRSAIDLPLPSSTDDADFALVLGLRPASEPRRLSVTVQGTTRCSVLVRDSTSVAVRIPSGLSQGRDTVRLCFLQPDSRRPADTDPAGDQRCLGLGFTTMSLFNVVKEADVSSRAVLMTCFTSLGDNCEFGFVQRQCGCEPISLLRFNGMSHAQLMRGLANHFEGFPDRSRMSLARHANHVGGHEYIVTEEAYGFSGHTAVDDAMLAATQGGAPAVLNQEHTRLTFLKRMLLENLEGSGAILVFKRNLPPDEAEVLAMWLELRRLGGATLLWVSVAQPDCPAGSVTMLADGLLKGYVDRFAPYHDAQDTSLESWVMMCRNAVKICNGQQSQEGNSDLARP